MDWQKLEGSERLFKFFKGVSYETRVDQIEFVALHLEVDVVFDFSDPELNGSVQVDLVDVHSYFCSLYFLNCAVKRFQSFLQINSLLKLCVVGAIDLMSHLCTSFLDHLQNNFKVCIELP